MLARILLFGALFVLALLLTGCLVGGELSELEMGEIDQAIREEIEKKYPLPDSVSIINHIGDTVRLRTDMTVGEVIEFYREKFTEMGLTELDPVEDWEGKDEVTLTFEGHESGKIVYVDIESGGDDERTKVTLRMKSE
ncbi:MAG TPA: hypothetical protein ENN19_07790 [Chloroflexi bacterium]|nr:hypothetical protein [Chloroflexota bacterium]